MKKRNILFSLVLLGTFSVGLSSCNTASTSYTIIWKNYDGTILDIDNVNYGATPTYDGETPLKASSDTYTYTFYGWSPEIVPVKGNATYTAQFTSSINQYLITFENFDGTSLQSSNWEYGSTPVYSEATPTKPSDSQYFYTFSSWSPAITTVTGNATYTAQFTSSTNQYLITFENYDGTSLQSSNWEYGSTPVYSGATPTKSGSSEYFYTFSGWSPEIVAVTSTATYTATFNDILLEGRCYLGSYPQTKVADSTLITTLNNESGTLPTASNSQSWTSYNYYISSSNTTNFMWYQDISVDEDLYRGVYFISYRNSCQDDNGYFINITYWFKFEPISWDVLSVNEEAGPLVLSSKVIDSQEYYHSLSYRTSDDGHIVYPNNYKESNIRTWLNNNFYNTAFSADEQNLIKTINVDNSVYSTGYDSNLYATTNTDDKLFLPSYREVVNADYGFTNSASRVRSATDYAKAMGVYAYSGNSLWWLRSPDCYSADFARSVFYGSIGESDVRGAYNGVLPAFRINR